MENNLYIGFNPHFLADAFSIIDTDKPLCRGKNNKSPMFIDGNEYSFVVLPINIMNQNIEEKIRVNIDRVA